MKRTDLIEFLYSTIESDAIIARIYRLFHVIYGYELSQLNELVQIGVDHGFFSIENVKDPSLSYTQVEWEPNNIFQEIIFVGSQEAEALLFSVEPIIPTVFEPFIS